MEHSELFFGDLRTAMGLFESVYFQEGLGRATEPISPTAARAFAQELILDPSVESARLRMRKDPPGATAFYEVAHRVRDEQDYGNSADKLQPIHTTSDGRHEPFLLVAAAVLNRLEDTDVVS